MHRSRGVWEILILLPQFYYELKTKKSSLCLKKMDKLNHIIIHMAFLVGSDGKQSAYNARDLGLIPGSGRFPWRRE